MHPPERALNQPHVVRDVSEGTIIMDDLDEDGKRNGRENQE